MKSLMICADDYAQNDEISTGIRMAYNAWRINAISCLTNMPGWPKAGRALIKMDPQGVFGLHLNFTFGQALSHEWQHRYGASFKALPLFILYNYFKRIDAATLYAECFAQLEAFRKIMGCDPSFIDGHQHVHQLPMVREALLKVFTTEHLQAFMRVSAHHRGLVPGTINPAKAFIIAHLGGHVLRHTLQCENIPTNTSFSGVYPFAQSIRYREFFKHFLSVSDHLGLIMCHPGVHSTDLHDPLHASRHHELEYLMSDAFLSDISTQGFQLSRERVI